MDAVLRADCEAEWQGTWYPAKLLNAEKGKYSIHYIGYDASSDECVGQDRIRMLRNPFGVKDIQDPDDQSVRDLAAKVKLTGNRHDANAKQWVMQATAGKKGSLDGQWFDRWGGSPPSNYGTGTEIKVVRDRVFMLVNASNGKFLLDLKRDKNRLLGKFQGIDNPADTGPCFFLIVNDERLDGVFGLAGTDRWDFRRRLK